MMYGKFAAVYDRLMEDVPYDSYAEWVIRFAGRGQLLDVAGGTGVLAEMLAEMGFQVTASDLSEEMLAVAADRFQAGGHDIPLYCLSMTDLEGLSGFDAVTIAIDSLNYLQTEQEVKDTFREAFRALNDGGQLFFDVHSAHKMTTIYLEGPFVYDDEDIAYIWHTEPGDHELSVIHDLTFFVRTGGLYERFEESHEQRTYPPEQYEAWLREAGFQHVFITADFSSDAPEETSERIFFRAVK
ncbi:class I SAM-dependent DNA methyltransferase [Planococcus lenghuensis]|uniref:SAM-dependent methyltransferase n=1 Tax=Planococcus lenghuensis TaxID=2213202 RepID=A0A1Q2KXL2_9BACL|nr:class I SAM-dependent methyltransferase [Planococcus lenghuensis]AQQ52948.1 SAM-dependent methyltransferase [Planococcus lenghuensis]